MKDDDGKPMPMHERLAEVAGTTGDLEQIKPYNDVIKQRIAAAKGRCKRAKVREKYRRVAADIAQLDDKERTDAIGELAIALHAHGLPLVMVLPVDPEPELPLERGIERAMRQDRPTDGGPMTTTQPATDLGEVDPASKANLDDAELDRLGHLHNSKKVIAELEALGHKCGVDDFDVDFAPATIPESAPLRKRRGRPPRITSNAEAAVGHA